MLITWIYYLLLGKNAVYAAGKQYSEVSIMQNKFKNSFIHNNIIYIIMFCNKKIFTLKRREHERNREEKKRYDEKFNWKHY